MFSVYGKNGECVNEIVLFFPFFSYTVPIFRLRVNSLRRKLKSRLIILGIFVLMLVVGISVCRYRSSRTASAQFARATEELFVSEMLANTLNMHYTIANPAAFGIEEYEVTLPPYAPPDTAGAPEILQKLDALGDSELSPAEKRLKTLLTENLKLTAAQADFYLYQNPLSPESGIQTQLPILLSGYTFSSRQDVEDYLALLALVPAYIDSVIAFQEQKNAADFLMPEQFRLEVLTQCRSLLTKRSLKEGTGFLQTSFNEKIAELSKQELLSQEEVSFFSERNNTLLLQKILPAYHSLSSYLMQMETENLPPEGLAAYPRGKEYYETLLRSEVGTGRTVAQLRALLEEKFCGERALLKAYLADNPAAFSRVNEVVDFPLTKSQEMLSDLQARMCGLFPTLPDCTVDVETVSPALAKYSAPAFFLTTPIDDTEQSKIYINPSKTCPGLELYTTLAHEGYPGHLYQNALTCRRILSEDGLPAESLLWYGGFLEGWALYSEFLGFDFASDLYTENGLPTEAVYAQIEKHNRSMQLCLYSLLDIMIHYDGACLTDITEYLEELGIRDAATIENLYNYICAAPCNYPKYYVGYLEILSLKEAAAEKWADSYSDYRFHSFCLSQGPADFQTLHTLLEETPIETLP